MKRKINFDRDGLTLVGNLFIPEHFDENGHYKAVIVEGSFTSQPGTLAALPGQPRTVAAPALKCRDSAGTEPRFTRVNAGDFSAHGIVCPVRRPFHALRTTRACGKLRYVAGAAGHALGRSVASTSVHPAASHLSFAAKMASLKSSGL
jgi:hypothetical protein